MMKIVVAYNTAEPDSLTVAQAYQAAHPRAVLLPLTVTTASGGASHKDSKFQSEVQTPVDAAFATCAPGERKYLIMCYGLPYRLYSNTWTNVSGTDSCLALPAADGGGYNGGRWLLNPVFATTNDYRANMAALRRHSSIRVVARIDGVDAAASIALITRAQELAASGWQTRSAYIDVESVDSYRPVLAVAARKGWSLASERTSWNNPQPPDGVSVYMRSVAGSPSGASFDLTSWPARGWMGVAVQSTGMLNMRSTSYWCPYMAQHGCAISCGAVAEPSYGGFAYCNVLYPAFLMRAGTWGECVLAATGYINAVMGTLGDPLLRLPAMAGV